MNPSRTTAMVTACLLVAVGMGMWLGRLLPVAQLGSETKDTIRLTTDWSPRCRLFCWGCS